MATPLRTAAKVFYYARNFARDLAPQALFRHRLRGWLEQARRSDGSVRERVNFYNRLQQPFVPSPAAVPVSRLPFSPSMYYYDLKEFARYFD
ncbi:MAG: lipopolysaccharide biosynthesis protein, partial [Mesorhizobium sp.]